MLEILQYNCTERKKCGKIEGTVYPILRRLTKDGYFATYLVESDSGPARKYYTMTDRGRIYLKKNILDWEEIMLLVNSILKGEGNDEQK